jgi:catechol 2,3-dioxygenase-like lactoylglutathione lyase family enzyme
LDNQLKGRRTVDWKIELVAIPVSDVDRAKTFYTEKAGFNADHDHRVSNEVRFVQLTPPGSACSIAIGTGFVDTPPGSVQGLLLVVSDIERGACRARRPRGGRRRGPGSRGDPARLLQRSGRQRLGCAGDPRPRLARRGVRDHGRKMIRQGRE